ncbi:chondroitin AC/alginate lyase [Mycena rebaudengoi]|nr:chondroitin AC/alginate lyase [Mycena rebaudengoi]
MASYDHLNSQGHNLYSEPYHNESTGGFITPTPRKKRTSNWIKASCYGILSGKSKKSSGVLCSIESESQSWSLLSLGAVVGGILATRKKHDKNADSSSSGGSSSDSAAAESAASVKAGIGRFATATNSDNKLAWPEDSFKPSTPLITAVRPDRPRLIAPAYKWAALPDLIANDPYMKGWNDMIFKNATQYKALPPVVYHPDGPSGILDNAREIKMRLKAFSYVYRMSKDTSWVDRAWEEIQNAAGTGATSWGPDNDKWNSAHFLDTAELTAGFAIAYDWLYDIWSEEQKGLIRDTIVKYGLTFGIQQFTTPAGWWRNAGTNGNWNCVCNSGMTMGALAILGDDQSGLATQVLGSVIDNANENCAQAVSEDGTWAETANYWYFGTTGHAEMASSLLTATGSAYGLLDSNKNFLKTGDFHMYVAGPTSLFNYGDHGPNKFSTTANSIMFYATVFDQPQYALYQREQYDAAEPWSMFWYDPTVSGAFWNGKPLDHFFDNGVDQWASMRSSWTDNSALYVAVKAGMNKGHQTHNDLDAGDFVLDALGTRWAGELGSADYNAPKYFDSGAQDAPRWQYYRKMTEGQNTILIDKANQNVDAAPTVNHGSSNTTQGPTTVLEVDKSSTAFWTTDMTNAYFKASSVKRGVRLLNGRKQVLIQDEINSQGTVQWRMHTNATIVPDSAGTTATLTLDGQTLTVTMLNPPDGAKFTSSDAVRFDTDPTPLAPDQENPGVKVLIVDLPAGSYTLQMLFNPQWPGNVNFVTPKSVTLDNWSLTSHDS